MDNKLPQNADARVAALEEYIARRDPANPQDTDFAGATLIHVYRGPGVSIITTDQPTDGIAVEVPRMGVLLELTRNEVRTGGALLCLGLAALVALWIHSRKCRTAKGGATFSR